MMRMPFISIKLFFPFRSVVLEKMLFRQKLSKGAKVFHGERNELWLSLSAAAFAHVDDFPEANVGWNDCDDESLTEHSFQYSSRH